MADEEQPAAPAPAAGTYDPATLNTIIQQLMQQPAPPQPVAQPSSTEGRGALSLLGEALGGGEQYGTTQQREAAGLRALQSMGMNMMANSGYAPVRTPFGQILASGMQGAQQSLGESQQVEAAQMAAQQQYAEKQQEMQLERLKTVLPLLRMQQGAGIPNLLAGGGGAAPGTNVAQGGSIASGATPALTGDLETDRKIIAQRESGGDPTALNWVARADPSAYGRGATASGKYQFVNSTWQDGLKLAGLDPSKYPTAMSAPESVQDQVFTAVYNRDGTKPWDASTFKQNWVPTPTGKMVLANVVPGGSKTAAAPPSATPPPTPVARPTAAPVAPPGTIQGTPDSGGTQVGGPGALPGKIAPPGPAVPGDVNAIMAGMKGAGASPTTLAPGAATAGPAAPPASTVVATNAPAPQTPTQADQPPAPGGPMTIEQYRALHPSNIDPSTFTVTPDPKALAQAEAERQTAAQNLQQARLAGDTAAANKALNAATEASSKIATLQQQAQVETAKMRLEAQNKAEALTQQGYNDEMTRQQQAQLKAQELAQTAAENDKQRQNQIEIERLKAGWTSTQHQQDTDMKVGTDQLTGMQAQAQKAEALQPMLQQLVPLLKDPKAPEGVVGQFLASHTEWLPTLTALGLDPKTANIAQLVKGLTDYLSLDLKPTGTGALRNQELPMLQGLFANLGQSKQTQQQALSRILNYTQRVKNEYDMATENFGAVDPKTNQPNYKILYKNIDAPMQLDENGTRIGGGLGPVVPEAPAPVANPNPGQLEAARRYQKYVANLPSGMPYNTYERQGDGSLQRVMKIHD